MTSHHHRRTAAGLALLLVLLPSLAAAAAAGADAGADAAAAAPVTSAPPRAEKSCCAPLNAIPGLQPPREIPVLLFTLPSPLPEKRNAEVVGRLCQCAGPSSSADAPDLAPASPDENEEQLVSLKIRGSTSARDYSKKSFNLNAANSTEFSLLGMPSDEKWAILGLQDDRTLGSRTSLPFDAYRLGFDRWAPRTRLAEVYVRVEGGATPAPLDYRGVYVASERITRGKKRVDVTRFDPSSPPASNSFMLSYENDNVRPGEPLVATKMSRLALVIEYPSAELLANASALALKAGGKRDQDPIAYLTTFFDGMERALLAPGPLVELNVGGSGPKSFFAPAAAAAAATATTIIAALPALSPFLDAQAALDYFLLTELTKNPDGYRGSVKMHKNASSPLVMGPPWDYGEAFGSCCGFPIEGYKQAGRSGPGSSGGSAISAQGWRFNICSDPGRCVVEPADGTSQWFRRLWQDASFRAGAAERWRQLRQGPLNDAFFVASLEANERRLTASGAAARNYARWSAEMPAKAEEMAALEKSGGLVMGGGVGAVAPVAPVAASASAAVPAPLAQFTAANLFLKQWVLARLSWMDAALAAVADPSSPPDAYLAVKA